ncbi:MAG: hypothetical protein E6I87_10090, partial [Chloroflexi bacterium]
PFLAPRRELVEEVRAKLPEMPDQRRARFIREYALSTKDAATLTESRDLADYFEDLARRADGAAKGTANFLLRDVLRALKEGRATLAQLREPRWTIAPILDAVSSGAMSSSQASTAFSTGLADQTPFSEVVRRPEYQRLSDESAVATAVEEAIAENDAAVKAYRAGKPQAFEAIVGAVMKKTRGRANSSVVRTLLKQRLA